VAKTDTTWIRDRSVYLKQRPKEPAKLEVYRSDIAPLHAYRILTIWWNRERCPWCEKEIHRGQEACLDLETMAVFCQICTKKHLLALVDAASKPKPRPKTARPRKQAKPPKPPTDEQIRLDYLETIQPELHAYYDVDLDQPAGTLNQETE
jgi:hypothetical protein